ncbi:MAG: flagellar biosynthesis protein FlhB [Bacillota bacterium]|nr:flagellar biosynthesis protein FlhB [Bacillota bacterium]
MIIRYYNLTLFSEEKTEQPTAKKLKDARQKGQIAQSKDFNSVVSLLAVFVALSAMWKFFADNLFAFFFKTVETIPTPELGVELFNESILFILQMSLPLLTVALITGLAASYAQVGVLFTAEPLKPQFNRINPLKGLKNMFSSRALAELVKSVAKAALILFVCYIYIEGRISEIVYTLKMDAGNTISLLWSIIFNVIIRCSIVLFIIAVFDYEFKRRKNKKELMMTKQEVKQEYKQSEGDPQLKGKIKEKQRQMAMSRMMQQVPKADVIITNPTHFAVALVYNTDRSDAPVVVAKGQDLIAQNIKRIAREHQIPMVENPPLARKIYQDVEIGDKISPDLYEAVAEVLAYVYSIKERKM